MFPMLKIICDLCQNEIKTDEENIHITAYKHYKRAVFCIDCFTKKTNWARIQQLVQKEKTK